MTRYLDRADPSATESAREPRSAGSEATGRTREQLRPPVQPHPPKREVFDVPAMTNTDPKGFVRAVEEYRVEDSGLYMARPMDGHPSLAYQESWLVPALNLRVTDFRFHPGAERDQDFYLDIATVRRDGEVWHSTDLYLDIVVRHGRDLEVVDGDELLAAVNAGLVTAEAADGALSTAFRAASGIAAFGYDVPAWLRSCGVVTTWRRR